MCERSEAMVAFVFKLRAKIKLAQFKFSDLESILYFWPTWGPSTRFICAMQGSSMHARQRPTTAHVSSACPLPGWRRCRPSCMRRAGAGSTHSTGRPSISLGTCRRWRSRTGGGLRLPSPGSTTHAVTAARQLLTRRSAAAVAAAGSSTFGSRRLPGAQLLPGVRSLHPSNWQQWLLTRSDPTRPACMAALGGHQSHRRRSRRSRTARAEAGWGQRRAWHSVRTVAPCLVRPSCFTMSRAARNAAVMGVSLPSLAAAK